MKRQYYKIEMKNGFLRRILIVTSIFFNGIILSQELPVLNPYHTNSFLYNPSLAGGMYNTNGSFFVAHKSSFVGVSGNPVSNVFNAHVPIPKYKIGIGGNIFVDKANILQTIYSSFSVAYHVPIHHWKSLSFGLSTDLYYLGVDMSKVDVAYGDIPDRKILQYNDGDLELDFSFGMNYQAEFFSCGATVNRLRKFPLFISDNNYSNCYYSAYTKYSIPLVRGRDMIEPMLTYRQLPFSPPQGNIGLIYSFKSRNSLDREEDSYWTLGSFVGTNSQFNLLMGMKLIKRIHLMYTYESLGKFKRYIGPSHEISLRYDMIILKFPDWNNEYLTWDSRKSRIKRSFSSRRESKQK